MSAMPQTGRAADPPVAGLTVLVVGSGAIASELASGLAGLGANVALAGAATVPAGVLAAAGAWRTREQAITTVSDAEALLGGLDAVIHAASVDGRIEDRLLSETDEREWDRTAEAPIRTALAVLQGAFASLQGRGGSIVVVIPSAARTGAAGLVGLATAAEGIRLLAKSAARAWGASGVRVNCVTAPIEQWAVVPAPGHVVPNRFGASLAEVDVASGIAGAVALLAGEVAHGVTGATIGADRGTVMAP